MALNTLKLFSDLAEMYPLELLGKHSDNLNHLKLFDNTFKKKSFFGIGKVTLSIKLCNDDFYEIKVVTVFSLNHEKEFYGARLEFSRKFMFPKIILIKFQNIMKVVYKRACKVILTAVKSLNKFEIWIKNGANLMYIYVYKIQKIIKKMEARLHKMLSKINNILRGPKMKIENLILHLGTEKSNFKNQSSITRDREITNFYEKIPDILKIAIVKTLKQKKTTNNKSRTFEAASMSVNSSVTKRRLISDCASVQEITSTTQAELNYLISQIQSCTSKEICDELGIKFCRLSNKNNCKKLIQALTSVSTSNVHLIPFYCRLVAVICKVLPEIGQRVAAICEDRFWNQLLDPELRNNNIRYMGELYKFKIISGSSLFATINFMLADPSQDNVESVFILLEKVGQTLDRDPKTTNRFKDQLKLMLRIINVKNLDFKQTPLVDYAYNLYKPHLVNKRIKPSTSVYLFVKEILTPNYRIKITKVSTKLRKLHYPEQESILLKALMEELNTNESCHSQLAYIVTNVSRIHPSISICLVDLLLEIVHRGMYEMEVNNMQRRTSEIKFLAELYSLKLVSTEVLMATLYLIIKEMNSKNKMTPIEIKEECFRVRLVLVILNSCGIYFLKGKSNVLMSKFLLKLTHCLQGKQRLSLDLDIDLSNLLSRIAPKLKKEKAA
jgi:hypothetical protein